jgi:ribosome-binding protein aMBF1 (putative translation factor)
MARETEMSKGFELAEKDWVSRQLEKPGVRWGFDQERASYEFCQQLETALSAEDISRSELAERLGKTKASVARSLKRGRNLTIKTMSELASACGMELHVLLRRRDQTTGPVFSCDLVHDTEGHVHDENNATQK